MTQPEKARLDASLRQAGDWVEIAFKISNQGDRRLYVLDVVILDTPSGPRADPDTLSARLEPPHTAVLSSWIDTTREVFSMVPARPVASAIAPGATHSVTLRAAYPLRLPTWHERVGPNGEPPDVPDSIVTCRTLRLELGVIPDIGDLEVSTREVEGITLSVLNEHAQKYQRVLSKVIEPVALPFLVVP